MTCRRTLLYVLVLFALAALARPCMLGEVGVSGEITLFPAALWSVDRLDYVLAHELVHVFQHREFDAFARMSAIEDPDELAAFRAVIEGHAELVALAVTAELGIDVEPREDPLWGREIVAYLRDPEPPAAKARLLAAAERWLAGLHYRQARDFVEAVVTWVGIGPCPRIAFGFGRERTSS